MMSRILQQPLQTAPPEASSQSNVLVAPLATPVMSPQVISDCFVSVSSLWQSFWHVRALRKRLRGRAQQRLEKTRRTATNDIMHVVQLTLHIPKVALGSSPLPLYAQARRCGSPRPYALVGSCLSFACCAVEASIPSVARIELRTALACW